MVFPLSHITSNPNSNTAFAKAMFTQCKNTVGAVATGTNKKKKPKSRFTKHVPLPLLATVTLIPLVQRFRDSSGIGQMSSPVKKCQEISRTLMAQ